MWSFPSTPRQTSELSPWRRRRKEKLAMGMFAARSTGVWIRQASALGWRAMLDASEKSFAAHEDLIIHRQFLPCLPINSRSKRVDALNGAFSSFYDSSKKDLANILGTYVAFPLTLYVQWAEEGGKGGEKIQFSARVSQKHFLWSFYSIREAEAEEWTHVDGDRGGRGSRTVRDEKSFI